MSASVSAASDPAVEIKTAYARDKAASDDRLERLEQLHAELTAACADSQQKMRAVAADMANERLQHKRLFE